MHKFDELYAVQPSRGSRAIRGKLRHQGIKLKVNRNHIQRLMRLTGSQLTSKDSTDTLKDRDVDIRMDDQGRCHDHIFVQRLRWAFKHETFIPYTLSITDRPHDRGFLDDRTPEETYYGLRLP